MDGKVDWMAYGLPVEGEDGPFIGDQVVAVPTCDVGGTVADARQALDGSDQESVVVVADGLALGEVDAETLADRADEEALLDVMKPVPSTYRPSVTVEALAEDGGGGRFLVSTSDGRLLGAVTVEAGDDDDHDHDHDHGDMEEQVEEVMAKVDERFGDRQPSEEELQAFLRELE